MKFVLLRHSELGKKEHDFYEKPLYFDTMEEAKGALGRWYDMLDGYKGLFVIRR